jgi:hypothetical protein
VSTGLRIRLEITNLLISFFGFLICAALQLPIPSIIFAVIGAVTIWAFTSDIDKFKKENDL